MTGDPTCHWTCLRQIYILQPPVRQSPEKKKAEEQVDDQEEDLERLADALEETALASYNLPRFKGE